MSFTLSDAGRQWAERIHWEPESLSPEKFPDRTQIGDVTSEDKTDQVELPALAWISDEVLNAGHFPEPLIRKLHGGIWANNRRHFAVLTGLSGAGKTLLARAYGDAIAGKANNPREQLCTIPVQPGWHDPSALLGYVNPLHGDSDSYIRTPFLEFLLTAADSPELPFQSLFESPQKMLAFQQKC